MDTANNTFTILEIVSYVIGILGIGGGVFSFLRYSNYKATVSLQNDNIKALQENNKIITQRLADTEAAAKLAASSHSLASLASAKEIGVLQGQVKLYSGLQLEKITEALVALAESNKFIAGSNREILDTLKSSAETLAEKEK